MNDKIKAGRELMSEMAHTMLYLSSMGYDTENLSIDDVIRIKKNITLKINVDIGEPTNEVKDAF